LKKAFPSWDSGKNYTIQIIYFIDNMFYDENCLIEENSYNPSIGLLAKDNFEDYLTKMTDLVKSNIANIYEENDSSSIKFQKFNDNHKQILEKITKQDQDLNLADRIDDFKNWFLNNFYEQIIKSNK
jgi:hypothetical protein